MSKCAGCGKPTEDDEPMDFGPYQGKPICVDCWDAECERVTAELHAAGECPDCVGPA